MMIVSVMFAGAGVATLLGQAPAWPTLWVWSIFAFIASMATTAYAITLNWRVFQVMTATVVAAALTRSYGYSAHGSTSDTTPTSLAGACVWIIVAALAVRAHIVERRLF